jgi:hypothetical protein
LYLRVSRPQFDEGLRILEVALEPAGLLVETLLDALLEDAISTVLGDQTETIVECHEGISYKGRKSSRDPSRPRRVIVDFSMTDAQTARS